MKYLDIFVKTDKKMTVYVALFLDSLLYSMDLIPHNLDFGASSFELGQSVGHKVSKQKLIFQNTECNDATKESEFKICVIFSSVKNTKHLE